MCGESTRALDADPRTSKNELGAELVNAPSGATVLTEPALKSLDASPRSSAPRVTYRLCTPQWHLLRRTLRLGVIPTLAPYSASPCCYRNSTVVIRSCVLICSKPRPSLWLSELRQGALDVLLLGCRSRRRLNGRLVSDRFLLAVPADDPLPERGRVSQRDVMRGVGAIGGGRCLAIRR